MKLWSGRFGKSTDQLVDDFHSSISFDQRLFEQDITGSIAHATMLGEQGIIPKEDADKIVEGLRGILEDAREGKIAWRTDAEDIHMNVEALLTERIGEAGKRLHTGRSRNDQVALDTRMYARTACREAETLLRELITALLDTAEKNLHTIMPGYTHLQKAQPGRSERVEMHMRQGQSEFPRALLLWCKEERSPRSGGKKAGLGGRKSSQDEGGRSGQSSCLRYSRECR